MQFCFNDVVGQLLCSWDDKTSSTTGIFCPRFPKTATKRWSQEIFDLINENNLYHCLFARDWFVLQFFSERLCLPALRLWLPSAFHFDCPTLFPEFVFPYSLQLPWIFFSVTENLCYSLVQQVTTSQQRPVLQPRQLFKAKMELWFSQ